MRLSLAAAALLAGASVLAQPRPEAPPDVPPPPLRLEGLIPVSVSGSTGVRWGVDPQSVQVTPDGLVRYVAVAQSDSGAVNAFHESLRCSAAEVKVLARHGRDGDWIRSRASDDWRSLSAGAATRHSLAIARAGACSGPMPSGDAAQVVRELRRGLHADQR